MTDLSRDPVINIIHNGIKRAIRVTLENECYGAVVILVYSGIDTMAYLNMPSNQKDVTKKDFIKWAEKYIRFPCREQLTGFDLYGARCGVLHSYSSISSLSREGKCREIGYMDQSDPEIQYNPQVTKDLVLVSISALAEVFLNGVDRFLIDLFSNSEKAKVAEKRFQMINHVLPYDGGD